MLEGHIFLSLTRWSRKMGRDEVTVCDFGKKWVGFWRIRDVTQSLVKQKEQVSITTLFLEQVRGILSGYPYLKPAECNERNTDITIIIIVVIEM